jgi:hypothetical protein
MQTGINLSIDNRLSRNCSEALKTICFLSFTGINSLGHTDVNQHLLSSNNTHHLPDLLNGTEANHDIPLSSSDANKHLLKHFGSLYFFLNNYY